MDPDDKVLLEGVKERQGDYIFTANKVDRVDRILVLSLTVLRSENTRFALRTKPRCRISYWISSAFSIKSELTDPVSW